MPPYMNVVKLRLVVVIIIIISSVFQLLIKILLMATNIHTVEEKIIPTQTRL